MHHTNSSRTSSSQGAKSDEKPDEDLAGSAATSNNHPNGAQDIEKALVAVEPVGDKQNRDDAFLVKWDEDDPANPRNWHPWYKAFITFELGILAFAGSLGSSIISPAEAVIAEEFNVSMEVMILCVSLYVLGFALGPSLWAPLSEVYGRRISILPAVFILGLFSIGTATSQNAASVLITRFFAGIFASAPISNVAAALGDMYEPKVRGTAVTFYAIAVVGGPTIGPVVGAACTISPSLGWRWTEYVEAIWVAVVLAFGCLTLPEVYPPVLLKRRARRLRSETGDSRYW